MRHGLDTLWLWLWLHNILIDHYCNIDNHNIGIVKNCLYLNNVTDIILSIKLWCRHITAVESSPESLTIFNTHTFTVSRGVFKHCNSYPHCNIPNIYHSPSNDLASVSGFSNTTLVGTKLSMLLFFSHACTYICILFSAKAFTWHPFILSPTTFYNFDHLLLFFWSRSCRHFLFISPSHSPILICVSVCHICVSVPISPAFPEEVVHKDYRLFSYTSVFCRSQAASRCLVMYGGKVPFEVLKSVLAKGESELCAQNWIASCVLFKTL